MAVSLGVIKFNVGMVGKMLRSHLILPPKEVRLCSISDINVPLRIIYQIVVFEKKKEEEEDILYTAAAAQHFNLFFLVAFFSHPIIS